MNKINTKKQRNFETAFLSALIIDDVTIVESSLKTGIDVNTRCTPTGLPLIHVALNKQAYKCLTMLLVSGADPNLRDHQGSRLLDMFSSYDMFEKTPLHVFEQILNYANVNLYDWKPILFRLMDAYEDELNERIEIAINAGADMEERFAFQTPLMNAALNYRKEHVELFVNHGADLEGMDVEGNTVYMKVVMAQGPEEKDKKIGMIKLLEKLGADVKVRKPV